MDLNETETLKEHKQTLHKVLLVKDKHIKELKEKVRILTERIDNLWETVREYSKSNREQKDLIKGAEKALQKNSLTELDAEYWKKQFDKLKKCGE